MARFKDYQINCPWKKDRWCRPANSVAGKSKCKTVNCPFWCLKYIINDNEGVDERQKTKPRTV